MSIRVRHILITTFFCALISACATNAANPTPNTVIVTPAANPGNVSINVGDILVVQIPTIPQTGFEWQVQNLDSKILQPQGDPVYKAGTDPNDAGGITTLSFSAVSSGNTVINLLYVNPGLSSGISSNSYSVSVEVK